MENETLIDIIEREISTDDEDREEQSRYLQSEYEEPTFRSFFENLGGKSSYLVELRKSSTLVIRSTSDFAKNANANCGM